MKADIFAGFYSHNFQDIQYPWISRQETTEIFLTPVSFSNAEKKDGDALNQFYA